MIKRLAWSVLPLVSFGLLSFAPFLYLRLTRKTRKDTGLLATFAAATTVEVVLLALVDTDDTEGIANLLGGAYLVVLAVVAAIVTWIEMKPTKEETVVPGRAYL